MKSPLINDLWAAVCLRGRKNVLYSIKKRADKIPRSLRDKIVYSAFALNWLCHGAYCCCAELVVSYATGGRDLH